MEVPMIKLTLSRPIRREDTVMSDLIERLEGVPSSLNDAFLTMQEASEEIQTLRSLLAQAEAQVETWREQASKKDAENTILRTQIGTDAATVCAELYQVIGSLAEEFGVFDHPDVQRALDNASAHKLVHRDLLPWPKQPLR
jgi:exonuclease VII small subunit